LGLVLIAASAVTAAILPSKSQARVGNPGKLTANSNKGAAVGVNTCQPTQDVQNANCTTTAGTSTTGSGQTSADAPDNDTLNTNTTAGEL
jgi:hypothetical protein